MPNPNRKIFITEQGKSHELPLDTFNKYGGAEGYAQDYPSATIRMKDSEGEYEVPLSKVNDAVQNGLHVFTMDREPQFNIPTPATNYANKVVNNVASISPKKITSNPTPAEPVPLRNERLASERENRIDTYFNGKLAPEIDKLVSQSQERGNKAAEQVGNMFNGAPSESAAGASMLSAGAYGKETDASKILSGIKNYISSKGKGKGVDDGTTTELLDRAYNYLIKKNIPQSTIGYILKNAFSGSMIGGLVSLASGKSAEQQRLEQNANEEYNPSPVTSALASAGSFALDMPAFGIAGRAAGAATRLGSKMIQKSIAKKLISETAGIGEKEAMQQAGRIMETNTAKAVAGRIASGAINQGTSLGLYNMGSDAINQALDIKNGGSFSIGKNLGEGARGFALGATSGLLGNSINHFSRNLNGIGRVASKAGSFAAETGVFSLPDIINGDDPKDALIKNGAMLLSMRASNLTSLKKKINPSDRKAWDDMLSFTPIEKEMLGSKGIDTSNIIGTVNSLNKKPVKNENVKDVDIDKRGDELASNYNKIMSDPSIPQFTKSKLSLIVRGKPTNISPMTSYSISGNTVTTFDKSGSPIDKRTFKNEDEANKFVENNDLDGKVAKGNVSYYSSMNDKYASNLYSVDAINKVASERGISNLKIGEIISKKANGVKLGDDEKGILDDIKKSLDENNDYSSNTSKSILEKTSKETGIDIAKSIGKDKNTPEEKDAIEEYLDNLKKNIPSSFGGTGSWSAGMSEDMKKSARNEYIDQNKSNIVSSFEAAEKKMNETFTPEEMNMDEKDIPEDKKAVFEEYKQAKDQFDEYMNTVRNKVDNAKQSAEEDVKKVSNPDTGSIIKSSIGDSPVYIVGGKIAYDENGTIDTEKSDDVIYYMGDDGKRKMGNPSLFGKIESDTPEKNMVSDMQDEAEKNIIDKEQKEIDNPINTGSNVLLQDGTTGTITQFYPGGKVIVRKDDGTYSEEDKSSLMPIKSDSDNMVVNNAENEVLPTEETNQNVSETPENNNIVNEHDNKPVYHTMPFESTVKDMRDKGAKDEDINDFANMRIRSLEKERKDLDKQIPEETDDFEQYMNNKSELDKKKKDVSDQIDYWNNLSGYLNKPKEAQPETPKENGMKETKQVNTVINTPKKKRIFYSKEDNKLGDSNSLREAVLRSIATGEYKFSWGDHGNTKGLGAHLGLKDSNSERKKMIGFLASRENGGLTPEEVAEKIKGDLGDSFPNVTSNDILNEIIDVFHNYGGSRSKIWDAAMKEHGMNNSDDEYYRQELEDRAAQNHMTPEEFQSYENDYLPSQLEEYNSMTDEDNNEIYSKFADAWNKTDQSNNNENENNSTGINEVHGEIPNGKGLEKGTDGGNGLLHESGTDNATDNKQGNGGREESPNPIDEKNSDDVHGLSLYKPETEEGIKAEKEFNDKLSQARDELNKAKSEYNKKYKEIYNRNGLFGDTKEDNSMFDNTSDFSAENQKKVLEPYQNSIDSAQRNIDNLLSLRDKYIKEADGQKSIDVSLNDKKDAKEVRSNEEGVREGRTSEEGSGKESRSDLQLGEKARTTTGNEREQVEFKSPVREEGENLIDYAKKISDSKKIYDEENKVDTNPSSSQKEKGNYKKGHVNIDGLDYTIENPKGSMRSGKDSDGEEWHTKMNNTYGYIRGTKGVDGDHIDMFLGDNIPKGKVFVVDQIDPKTNEFDEHKVMYGFDNIEDAKKAYLSNYSKDWKGLGRITEISKEDFKKWIDSSFRKTKPFSEYKSINKDTPYHKNTNIDFPLKSGKKVNINIERTFGNKKEMIDVDGDKVPVTSFKNEYKINVSVPDMGIKGVADYGENKEGKVLTLNHDGKKVSILLPEDVADKVNKAIREKPSNYVDNEKERITEAVNRGNVLPKEKLDKKIKEYDNEFNEGGYGYNPYRDHYVSSEQVENSKNDIRFRSKKRTDELGKSDEKIYSSIKSLSERLNTPVNIIPDKNSLDNDIAERLDEDGSRHPGWFDPKTGKVNIYLPDVIDSDDAERTALHEIVGHKGLRGLYKNEDDFNKGMNDIFMSLPEDVRMSISSQAIKKGFDINKATEEYLASKAEDNINPTWWNKVTSRVKDMLRSLGLNVNMNDNDVKYLLWRSANRLEKGTPEENLSLWNRDSNIKDKLFRDVPVEKEENIDKFVSLETLKDQNIETKIKTINNIKELSEEQKKDYMKSMRNSTFQEKYVDSFIPVLKFQNMIQDVYGIVMPDFCNAYMNENTINPRSMAEKNTFEKECLKPLVDTISRLGDYGEVTSYMKAKHGLERNEYIRAKKIEEKKGEINKMIEENPSLSSSANKKLLEFVSEQNKTDYAGLTGLQHRIYNDGDTPLDENLIRKIVDDFESSRSDSDISSLWDAVNKATYFSLDKEYSSGQISRDRYEQTKGMYKYYIPLRGWAGQTAEDIYTYYYGDRYDGIDNPMMKAKGRKSEADDPVSYIASMADASIIMGNRNIMKQHVLRMIRNYPTDMASVSPLWYVKDNNTGGYIEAAPELESVDSEGMKTGEIAGEEDYKNVITSFNDKMDEMEKQGLAKKQLSRLDIGLPIKKWQAEKHAVRVKENGIDHIIYFNSDPRVSQAINSMNKFVSPFDGKVMKFYDWAKNWRALSLTSRNPAFVMTNLSRDMIQAFAMNAMREPVKYQLEFTKSIPHSSSALFKYLSTGKYGQDKYGGYLKEFMEQGGETGFTQLYNSEKWEKEIKSYIDKANKSGKFSDATRIVGRFFENCNRWAEDTTRFSAYIASRETGRSIVRSVNDAKELTTNFNRKGAGRGSYILNHAFLFWNAGVQDLNNVAKTIQNHPIRSVGVIGSFFMNGALMPLVWKMFGKEEDYYNIPDWVRQNNIVIPFLGNSNYITIPMPIFFRSFYGSGDILTQAISGRYEDRNAMADIVQKIMDIAPKNFLDSNSIQANKGEKAGTQFIKTLLKNMVPDMASPAVEAYITNRTFSGRPIAKDNDFNGYTPEFRKVYRGTSQISVKTSEELNKLTGGNWAVKGWADSPLLNPARIEHLVYNYLLGGVGRTILQTGKSVIDPLMGDGLELRNVPVINRFAYHNESSQNESIMDERYNNLIDDYNEWKDNNREYKKGIKKGMGDLTDPYVNSNVDKNAMIMHEIGAYKNRIDALRIFLNNSSDDNTSKEINKSIVQMKKEMLEGVDNIRKTK